LRRGVRGDALLTEIGALLHQIAQISLKRRDQLFSPERRSVPRKVRIEIKSLERVECRQPFGELRVAHVCDLRFHEVARGDDLLLRQEHHRVAVGVTTPKEQQLHLAPAEIEHLFC